MKFCPEPCAKCSPYNRRVCEKSDVSCKAFRTWLETSKFAEEFRNWVLGGCQPEEAKAVWRYGARREEKEGSLS